MECHGKFCNNNEDIPLEKYEVKVCSGSDAGQNVETRKKSSKQTERNEEKSKKRKLPGQPNRPMSAYYIFMSEYAREKVKSDNPGFSMGEIGKKCKFKLNYKSYFS